MIRAISGVKIKEGDFHYPILWEVLFVNMEAFSSGISTPILIKESLHCRNSKPQIWTERKN